MTNLIERLRKLAGNKKHPWQETCGEAADALDRQAQANIVTADILADMQKERDDLKAKLAEAESIERELANWQVECASLTVRAEKAEAEAAALREAIQKELRSQLFAGSYERLKAALSQPGPGAAYRKRKEKLEVVADKARRFDPTGQQFACDPQDEIQAEAELAEAFAALDVKEKV